MELRGHHEPDKRTTRARVVHDRVLDREAPPAASAHAIEVGVDAAAITNFATGIGKHRRGVCDGRRAASTSWAGAAL